MGYYFIVIEQPINLEIFLDAKGKSPFLEWLSSIKDVQGKAIIRTRLNPVRLGNFGNIKSVGKGINELRIIFGPG